MISRVTLWSLLLALLIPSGIAVWSSGHRDSCSRFLAGDRSLPATQTVAVGSEMMEIPCRQWLPRQTVGIQAFSLLDLLALLVFAIHAVGDVRERMQGRGRSKGR